LPGGDFESDEKQSIGDKNDAIVAFIEKKALDGSDDFAKFGAMVGVITEPDDASSSSKEEQVIHFGFLLLLRIFHDQISKETMSNGSFPLVAAKARHALPNSDESCIVGGDHSGSIPVEGNFNDFSFVNGGFFFGNFGVVGESDYSTLEKAKFRKKKNCTNHFLNQCKERA